MTEEDRIKELIWDQITILEAIQIVKKKLEERIRTSRFRKRTREVYDVEMGKSFC